jgi:uncharacterized protein (TIGR02271 family)
MAKQQTNQQANQDYKAVGVFTDRGFAEQVVQQLKAAGYQAQVVDEATVQDLGNQGFTSQDEIQLYQSRFREGNAVVLVDAGTQGQEILDYLLQNGAENIDLTKNQQGARQYQNLSADQRQYGPVDATTGRARSADEARMVLRREQLVPTKQAVQAGEVGVHKVVHERQQEIPVTLTHEEITIERRPLEGAINAQEAGAFEEQTIRVPVYEEQVQLQKQVTGEEVVVHKQQVQEQRTVSGTTRHEHVQVDQSGNVQVQGDGQATDQARYADGEAGYIDNNPATGANPR